MASRDHWIWHVWLSRNLRQNNSSNLCIETQQKQRDFWSPHVSKLSKSTAWLHVSICNFRTRKDILGCKRRISLCILSSVFEHPLNPEHACTCNLEVNGVGWHNLVFLQFSWQKTAIQTLSISKVTYELQKYTFNLWAWDKLLKLLSVLLLNCRLFARFSLPIEMTILHATRSGGFSDMKKRRDFEGRAPRLHETVGFGTSGSARTTQNHTFQTKSAGAFWKLDDPPRATRSNILLYWERVWPMQREMRVSSHTFPNRLHEHMIPSQLLRNEVFLGYKRRVASCSLSPVFNQPPNQHGWGAATTRKTPGFWRPRPKTSRNRWPPVSNQNLRVLFENQTIDH